MATARTRKKVRPEKQQANSRTLVVKKFKLEGDEAESPETEEIQVHEFVTEPAYVRAAAGVTRSLGAYESLRVDVSISIPCYVEEIDRVYGEAADKVSELLDEEVKVYLGETEED